MSAYPSADAATTNLPHVLSSLVGRERELTAVVELLRRPGVRLVSLTGSGGVGKTRLALEAATRLLGDPLFPDGVLFAPLADIRDPALVVPAVAAALRIGLSSNLSAHEALERYFRDLRVLLVLDNLEQIVAAVPDLGHLLEHCPGLRLLATSRVPLRLRGEHEYPVPPLGVPDARAVIDPTTLVRFESTRLFVERATEVRPGFSVNAANAPAIAEICRRLDGLPLAIELAAARSRVLAPPALLANLATRLMDLSGGPRDLPERQQTLRAAVAWSYALLPPAEQRLFRALSAFAGGCTYDAAQALSDIDIFEPLAALVEHSLVVQVEQPDGGERYRMLETIREFGREQLRETGELHEVGGRAARYIAGQIHADAPPTYWATILDDWMALCSVELANIRAALDWFLEQEPLAALRLSTTLYWFWRMRGYLNEGRDWITQALALLPDAPEAERMSAEASLGDFACWQGSFDDADRHYAAALTFAERLGDNDAIGRASYGLARSAQFRGDAERARAGYEVCLAFYESIGDTLGAGAAEFNLAAMLGQVGEYARAEQLYTKAIQREGRRDSSTQVITLANLAALAMRQHQWARAIDYAEQALRLYATFGDMLHTIETLEHLAPTLAATGHAERGARLWGAAQAQRERVGYSTFVSDAPEFTEALAWIEGALDSETLARCLAEGRALSIEEAIALALTKEPEQEIPAPVEPATPLSPRELEVVRLLAEGKTNQEIAAALFISPNTVSNHVVSILNKLGLESRTAVAAYAVRHGLV
jgi:non-specific serine/threonine protein kinase